MPRLEGFSLWRKKLRFFKAQSPLGLKSLSPFRFSLNAKNSNTRSKEKTGRFPAEKEKALHLQALTGTSNGQGQVPAATASTNGRQAHE